jgi:cell division protein FtsB
VVKTAPPTLQTTLIFLGLTLYLGTTVFRLCVQEWHLFKQAQVLEAERAAVVAHHQALTQEIATSRTNAGIEKLAREQLGLVMAAEIPVKTVAPATTAPTVTAAVVAQAPATPRKQNDVPPAMAALVKFFAPLWN